MRDVHPSSIISPVGNDSTFTVRQSWAWRSGLHFYCASEVVAGLGVIRFQAERFLELTNRLVNSVLSGEGNAEVAVGLGVIRLPAEGFLELADGLVHLAFLGQRIPEVVTSAGVIGLQADGFLELADRPGRGQEEGRKDSGKVDATGRLGARLA